MPPLTQTATSTPTEGAIRFRYVLRAADVTDALDAERFKRLAAWRQILKQLKLIGRAARRYDGFAFGNLSVRDTTNSARFFITASQTSGAPRLLRRHVVRVDEWNARSFEVVATGAAPPSSESITHGMVYAADARIGWIMHVHAPVIWRAATRLGLPATPAEVEYGSPAMASAVGVLLERHSARPMLFATLGHEDGIFACGASADDTGAALIRALADARADTTR
jgi:ribulose-5-phosphate 4-epimerase/fuculose-1-phosphate aldolase